MVTLSHRVLALSALAAFTAAARADVLVIDPAGGPGGALLQSTIQAAHDGDILLLRAGDYTDADIVIEGKLVSLVADPQDAEVVLRHLTVTLPATLEATPVLRGLRCTPSSQTPSLLSAGMSLQGPASDPRGLWVEDCTSSGSLIDPDGPGGLPHAAGAGVLGILLRPGVFMRCQGTGADGFDAIPGEVATGGGAGLDTFLSYLVVDGGGFTGGTGGDGVGDGTTTTNGGDGIHSIGGVWVMGSTLRGGDEGAGNWASVQPGAGLGVLGSGYVRDIDALPGHVVGLGTPNDPIHVDPNSNLFTMPAPARDLVVDSPLREGQSGTLRLHGVVGDGVWVYVGASSGIHSSGPAQGAFVLGAVLPAPIFLGAITDASGDLSVAFHLPELPAGMDGLVIFLQAAMAPATGGLVLGSGSALVWVSAEL